MARRLRGRWATLSGNVWRPRYVAGGKSNLTFELTSAAGEAVLRRPPDGPLLPRAHDMAREARVQRALAATAVPVPAILFEDAGELIGVPFYVMEKVDGYVIRDTIPAGYAESPQDRRAIADVLADTLADLHAVDPSDIGLAGFGRPSGLGERQVRRWGEQWERSKSRDVPAVDELARRLRATRPAGPRGSNRARGFPDRQLPAGQADAASRGGRTRLGARHAGRAAGRSRPAAVLLAAKR